MREEQDSKIVRQTHYQDWHRVERARSVFVIKAITLREEGWQEISPGQRPGPWRSTRDHSQLDRSLIRRPKS